MTFIRREDLCLPEQGPGEAHQLPLTHGEVGAALEDLVIKPRLEMRHHALTKRRWNSQNCHYY